MWQCITGRVQVKQSARRGAEPLRRRLAFRPSREQLEARELLTVSLQPISDQSVPSQLGYQLPLDGSAGSAATQTFTATSSNPNIKVSVAQGPFWTITVSHQAANASDITIDHETMTFQLFQDLTPHDGEPDHQPDESELFHARVPEYHAPGTGRPVHPPDHVGGVVGLQRRPGRLEQRHEHCVVERDRADRHRARPATGVHRNRPDRHGQHRQPVSTDAQFFITSGCHSTSVQQAFDFNYTIFGQLVSGQKTVTDLSNVAVQVAFLPGENFPADHAGRDQLGLALEQ